MLLKSHSLKQGTYLHGVFLSFQLASYEFDGAFFDVIPQITALLKTGASRLGECVTFGQLKIVAGAIECDDFV